MRTIDLFAAALLAFTGTASALEPAKVDYSADSYMETAEGVMKGRVYVSPGKERREFSEGGEQMVMIIRQDKKTAWMLMPEDEMYMELKMEGDGRKDDLTRYKIEQSEVGKEKVNGVDTVKNKIVMTGPKGEKLGGFWWITKDNIVVKMDAISIDKKDKDRFKIELKNLKVGKVDSKLFEIPKGYEKMSMGGIGDLMRGADGDE